MKIKEEIHFLNKGTFEAYNAAEAWANENGYTAGSMSCPHPTGLIKGDYDATDIPLKWKNFKAKHRNVIDGAITGDFREGPVTVTIFQNP